MESQSHPNDIPIWWNGTQRWMTGLTKRTTCDDVIYALLYSSGLHETDSTDNYAIFEKWREVERPLSARTKLLKVWTFWDQEQANVKLSMRSLDDYFLPGESSLYVRSKRRHRRNSVHRSRHSNNERCVAKRSCVECSRLRSLEQLVKLVVSQERKIQELNDRIHRTDRQVDNHEVKIHQHRVEQNGLDYVQNSYLNSHSSSSNSSIDSSTFTTIDLKKVKAIFPDSSWQQLEEIIRMADDLTHMEQRLTSEQSKVKELTPEVNKMMEEMGLAEEQEQETNAELEDVKIQMVRILTNHITNEYKEKELDRKSVVLQNHLEAKMEILRDLQNQLTRIDREMNSATEDSLPLNFTLDQHCKPDFDFVDSSNSYASRENGIASQHTSHENQPVLTPLRHTGSYSNADLEHHVSNHDSHNLEMGEKSVLNNNDHYAYLNLFTSDTVISRENTCNGVHKPLIACSEHNNTTRHSTYDKSLSTKGIAEMEPSSSVPSDSRNRGRLRDIKKGAGARSRSEERGLKSSTINESLRHGQARIAMGWDEEKGLRYSPAILNQYGLDPTNCVSPQKRLTENTKHNALIKPSPTETKPKINEGGARTASFDKSKRASETKLHTRPGGGDSGRNAWTNKGGNCNQESQVGGLSRKQSAAKTQDTEAMHEQKAESITLFEQSVTPSSAPHKDGMGFDSPGMVEAWSRNSKDHRMAPIDSRIQTPSNTCNTRQHRTISKEEDTHCSNSQNIARSSSEGVKDSHSPLRIQESNCNVSKTNTPNPFLPTPFTTQTTQVLSTIQTSQGQHGEFVYNSHGFPLPCAGSNSNRLDHQNEIRSQMNDAASLGTEDITQSLTSQITANSRQGSPSSSHARSSMKHLLTPTHNIYHFTQSSFDNHCALQMGHSGPSIYHSYDANHVNYSSTSSNVNNSYNDNSSSSSNSNNLASLQSNKNNHVNRNCSTNYDSSICNNKNNSSSSGETGFIKNGNVEERRDQNSGRGALYHILSNKLNKSKPKECSSGLYNFRNSSSLSMDNLRDFTNPMSESNTRNNLHYYSESCSSSSNATINASSSSTETLTQQTLNSSFNKDINQVNSDSSPQSSHSGQNINNHRQYHQHANSYDGNNPRSGNRYQKQNDRHSSGSQAQNIVSFLHESDHSKSRGIMHNKSGPSSRSMDQIYLNAYDRDRDGVQTHVKNTHHLAHNDGFITTPSSHGRLDKTSSGNKDTSYLQANQNSLMLSDASESNIQTQDIAEFHSPTTVSASPRIPLYNQNPPPTPSRSKSQQSKTTYSSKDSSPVPSTPGNRRRRVNPYFCDIDEKEKSVTDISKYVSDLGKNPFNSENGFQKSTLVSGEEFGNRKVTFSNINDSKDTKFINIALSSSDQRVVDIRNIVPQRDLLKIGVKGGTTKILNNYKESLSNGHLIIKSKLEDSNDSNSDTGLSSMHSDETANLETLV